LAISTVDFGVSFQLSLFAHKQRFIFLSPE
jgi:hypothetical protein